MRTLGAFLYIAGGLGVLAIDILSSFWLLNNHGLGWVLVSWITFIPLFIIPFFAGLGIPFVAAAAATIIGSNMVEAD